MDQRVWINIWMALSNFLFLGVFGWRALDLVWSHWWFGSALIGSVLMHLFEQKHGLPGLWPSSARCAWWSLQLDRCTSMMAGFACLYYFWKLFGARFPFPKPMMDVNISVVNAVVGCLCLLVSELSQKPEHLGLFVAFHTIWHFCAFTGMTHLLMEVQDPGSTTRQLRLFLSFFGVYN